MTDRPLLARRARLRWDGARNTHVALLPESVLVLTRTAAEVLALCDGRTPRAEIIAQLAKRYPGAPVERDVNLLLDRLRARGLLETPAAPSAPSPPGVRDSSDCPSPWGEGHAGVPGASGGEGAAVHPGVPGASGGEGAAGHSREAGASGGEGAAGHSRGPSTPGGEGVQPPVSLLAELTYRCPLRCGYCSNPTDLGKYRDELATPEWERVFAQAADLGVLQLHFSGGEPLLRPDLADLIRVGHARGMYTNLITSAYGLTDARLDELVAAGIDHVQVSVQDATAERGDPIAGTRVHEDKLRAARAVRARGIALSINAVIHRQNIDHVEEIIALAEDLGAQRLELATAQYHGWALANRAALLPARESLDRAAAVAADAQRRLAGRMSILYVLPDYYTDAPKPCMDGWGRRFVTVTPGGTVLPCPGAHALPLAFPSVRDTDLSAAWFHSEGMNAYRGHGWMPEPCTSCERRDQDHGGCRCQAFALTGNAAATDPACRLSPHHDLVLAARARASSHEPPPEVLYRVRTGR